jgi:hypothetical protein
MCLYVLAPLLSPGASLSFQLTRAPLSGHLRTGYLVTTELISRADYRSIERCCKESDFQRSIHYRHAEA